MLSLSMALIFLAGPPAKAFIFLRITAGRWGVIDTGLTSRYVYAIAAIGTNLFAGTYGPVGFIQVTAG